MAYTVVGSGIPVFEDDINNIERVLKVSFPKDYKNFLFEFNGGRPRPKCFSIDYPCGVRVGQILDFFGIYDEIESCNIAWNYHVFSGRMPSGFFPIACEDGGNIICLCIEGENLGKVYYWDHDQETVPPGFSNIYRINDTLDGFLNGLFSPDENH